MILNASFCTHTQTEIFPFYSCFISSSKILYVYFQLVTCKVHLSTFLQNYQFSIPITSYYVPIERELQIDFIMYLLDVLVLSLCVNADNRFYNNILLAYSTFAVLVLVCYLNERSVVGRYDVGKRRRKCIPASSSSNLGQFSNK